MISALRATSHAVVPKENVVIFGPQIPHAHLFKDGGKAIFHRENQVSSVQGENGNGGSLGQGSVFLSEELEHGSLGSAVPWGGLAAGAQSPLCTGVTLLELLCLVSVSGPGHAPLPNTGGSHTTPFFCSFSLRPQSPTLIPMLRRRS